MPDRSRIPRLISTFNPYIINTSKHLADGTPVNNATRLGLTEVETKCWTELADEWLPLYKLYIDKKNSRTVAIKDQLLDIIRKTVQLDRASHILDRIGASTQATIEDAGVFRIKKGITEKKTRTKPQTPITEQVVASIKLIGGGLAKVKCGSSTSQRASIYGAADSVECLYAVGHTPPDSAQAPGLQKALSTRATFILPLGAEHSGECLYIYFRWYSTRHPRLAGPWSSLQTVLVL
jgi:hypothetical protein